MYVFIDSFWLLATNVYGFYSEYTFSEVNWAELFVSWLKFILYKGDAINYITLIMQLYFRYYNKSFGRCITNEIKVIDWILKLGAEYRNLILLFHKNKQTSRCISIGLLLSLFILISNLREFSIKSWIVHSFDYRS